METLSLGAGTFTLLRYLSEMARVIEISWDFGHTGRCSLGNKVLAVLVRIPLIAL